MTQTSEPGIKSEHSEGERTRGHEPQTTNAERHAISDNSEHLRFAIADLEMNSGFGFLQHSVRISRGVRYAVVDVEVSFLYRVEVLPDKYPDVRTVVSDTLAFLQNYPEKRAYWEIYARDAASKLFKDYGVFSSLTVTLVIHPDDQRAFLRTATATVLAAADSSRSAGTERCAVVSTRSSPSGTTFRNIVGSKAGADFRHPRLSRSVLRRSLRPDPGGVESACPQAGRPRHRDPAHGGMSCGYSKSQAPQRLFFSLASLPL